MASDRFVLTRPIYIDDTSKDFTVDVGGTPAAASLTTGTYPCIASVIYELEQALQGHDPNFSVTMSSDFMITISISSGTFSITWDDTRLRDILGFSGNLTTVSSDTAPYTPLYCWFPDKVRADRNRWVLDQKIVSRRVEVQTGATPGLTTGDEIFRLRLALNVEPAENLLRSAATTSQERDRCLEVFMLGGTTLTTTGCIHAWPGDSGEPSPAGFYFWPDYTDLDTLSSMDEGSAEDFDLASGASTYCFAQFDANFTAEFRDALPVGRTHYNIECAIHSVSTAPYGGGSWVSL